MLGSMPKNRRYSDEERAAAVAAMAAYPSVNQAAKSLGIPRATLESWAKGIIHPEAARDSASKKGPLADAVEAIARQIADALPGKVPDADLKDAAVAFGVLVDKMQILRGKPTEITKTDGTVTSRIDRFEIAFVAEADRQGQGDPSGNGAGEQVDTRRIP